MKKLLFVIIFLLSCNFAFSQAGTGDTTFNTIDAGNGFGDGANGSVSQAIKLSDGKNLLVGNFTTYNGVTATRIVKINTDGSIDTSFSSGTGADAYVYSVAEQADGKILIGGSFTKYNGATVYRLARLNANGTLDTTFSGAGSGPNALVNTITVLPSGKIMIGGSFTLYNDDYTAFKIARLNNDGSYDSTFMSDPGAGSGSNTISKIYYYSDIDKYLAIGTFTTFNGTTANIKNLVMLNNDGTVYTNFQTGSGFGSTVSCVERQTDGKFLVGGSFTTFNGTTVQNLIRLNADGNLDTSFNNSANTTGGVYIIKSIGSNIYIGGNFTTYNGTSVGRFAKLDSAGNLDSTFNPGQSGANGSIQVIIANADNSFYIQGSFNIYNDYNKNYFTLINNDGSLNKAYNAGTGADAVINAIATLADKKMLIGGAFTSYNGSAVGRLAKLNNDGSLDSSFNIGNTGIVGSVSTITTSNDGKVIVGGTFTKYNNIAVSNLLKINSDGTQDSTFNTALSVFNNSVASIAIQSDNKILVGGSFTTFGSTSSNRLIRLNSDGTVDIGFSVGTGANSGSITAIVTQTDGKILLAGNFTSFNGKTAKVIRLNSDGSLDTSFTGGAANFLVNAIALQADGKILIGGNFTTVNGGISTRVARLNTDGTTDASFTPSPVATLVNGAVLSMAIQADGKIILGGVFTQYSTTSSNGLMRLNSDGSLDTTFSVGTGANGTTSSNVNVVTLDDENKLLIGGAFSNYNGIGKNRIARVLLNTPTMGVDNIPSKNNLMIYPNPVVSEFHIQSVKDVKSVTVFDVSGKIVEQSTKKDLQLDNLQKGTYIVKITTSDNRVETKKIIKK